MWISVHNFFYLSIYLYFAAALVGVSLQSFIAFIVTEAIILVERGGSSLLAIKKYINGTYKCDSQKLAPFIKKYLKTSVASGKLIQTKGKGASGSFKLSAAATKDPKGKANASGSEKKAKEKTVSAVDKKKKKSVTATKKSASAVRKKSGASVAATYHNNCLTYHNEQLKQFLTNYYAIILLRNFIEQQVQSSERSRRKSKTVKQLHALSQLHNLWGLIQQDYSCFEDVRFFFFVKYNKLILVCMPQELDDHLNNAISIYCLIATSASIFKRGVVGVERTLFARNSSKAKDLRPFELLPNIKISSNVSFLFILYQTHCSTSLCDKPKLSSLALSVSFQIRLDCIYHPAPRAGRTPGARGSPAGQLPGRSAGGCKLSGTAVSHRRRFPRVGVGVGGSPPSCDPAAGLRLSASFAACRLVVSTFGGLSQPVAVRLIPAAMFVMWLELGFVMIKTKNVQFGSRWAPVL
uniref:H15 domain-containing protein n=1 Tax=Glossina pallidipes TaxID=7398 RepID=A0A1A9ZPV1_GLOPL